MKIVIQADDRLKPAVVPTLNSGRCSNPWSHRNLQEDLLPRAARE
jgi:hypothetical protein